MTKARSSTAWMTRAELQRALGRSRAVVDQLLAEGLPHETVGSGRGATIRIPRDRAMAWLADRAARKSAAGSASSSEIPEGLQILKDVPNLMHRALIVTALEAIYSVTWYARFIAVEHGVDPDRAEKISAGTAAMLVEHFERAFRAAGIEAFRVQDPAWLQPEQAWWLPGRGLRQDLAIPAVGGAA